VIVAFLAFTCAAPFVTAAQAETPPPKESLATFEGQLHGHQVSTVTLRTKAHTFRVVLADGHVVSVVFPSAQQQQLARNIEAAGITMKVAKVQPPSHKRRYIVGAMVIVVIVLAVAGVLVSSRRRRRREEGK
jgi:ATP-dependent Zn protease